MPPLLEYVAFVLANRTHARREVWLLKNMDERDEGSMSEILRFSSPSSMVKTKNFEFSIGGFTICIVGARLYSKQAKT